MIGDTEGASCGRCHEDVVGPRGGTSEHPRGAIVRDLSAIRSTVEAGRSLGPGATVICTSCHSAHDPDEAEASCASCHRGYDEPADGGHGGKDCGGCHSAHRGTAGRGSRRLPSPGDPGGCLSCHGDGEADQPESGHPGKRGHVLLDSAVGRPRGVPPLDGCGSCHGHAHEPRGLGPESCERCHEEQSRDRQLGGHGTATCLSCHPAHEAWPQAPPSAMGLNPASRPCLACHAPDAEGRLAARKVARVDHPDMVFLPDGRRWTPLGEIPLFGAGGEVMPQGENGDLACSSCHVTHGPQAGRHEDGLLRGGWEGACAACHGRDALPLFLFFHDAGRRRGLGGSQDQGDGP